MVQCTVEFIKYRLIHKGKVQSTVIFVKSVLPNNQGVSNDI